MQWVMDSGLGCPPVHALSQLGHGLVKTFINSLVSWFFIEWPFFGFPCTQSCPCKAPMCPTVPSFDIQEP